MRSAVILAAGAGTKIFPYQETRQKAAIPVANVPLIRRLVLDLQSLGITDIIVVTGYLKGQVHHALSRLRGIRYVAQERPSGTAAALDLAMPLLEDAPFLVLHGDITLGTGNLEAVCRRFEETGAEAAVLMAPLRHERSLDWLVGEISGEKVAWISGHSRDGSHRLCGVYAFRPSIKSYLFDNPGIFTYMDVGAMPPVDMELASSVQMMIEDGQEVLAVETTEFFVDIDKPWHILEANARAVEYMASRLAGNLIHPTAAISPQAKIEGYIVAEEGAFVGDGVEAGGHLWLGRGASLTRGAMLGGNNAVGSRTSIRDYCLVGRGTVIGNRCIVGHGAEIDGVMFDRSYLYHYCEIAGVVGAAVDIGAATVCGTLRFDDEDTIHRIQGRREFPTSGANATYLGDYSRTGVNVITMPGAKIGPYSCVGPGVIVYEDIPARTLVLVKQELIHRPWGPERYGW